MKKLRTLRSKRVLTWLFIYFVTGVLCQACLASGVTNSIKEPLGPVFLSISPNKTTLNPGDEIAISISESWRSAKIEWILSSKLETPGKLSSNTGSDIIYLAPNEEGLVEVSVMATIDTKEVGAASILFTIVRPTVSTDPPIIAPDLLLNSACYEFLSDSNLERAIDKCSEINTGWVCYGAPEVEVQPIEYRFHRVGDRRPLSVIKSLNVSSGGVAIIRVAVAGQDDPVTIALLDDQPADQSIGIIIGPKSDACQAIPPGIVFKTEEGASGRININGVVIRLE